MDNIWLVAIALAVAAAFGLICARIASMKGRNPVGYGLLGFFVPLIGLMVVGLLPSKSPELSA